ncbi:MAG: DUF3306 domain-containing protein [Roseobacter sp.]
MSEVSSFWARRKAAVAAEAEAEAHAAVAVEEAERQQELAQKDDAEILAEMGLPDPTEMQQGDDFSAFMSRDVPEHLRKVALRTLWRSNPVLANVDGLNEYDDDYRAAMLLKEPIKTAYQVGKGMLKHIEEMERQAAEADQPKEADIADVPEEEGEVIAEAVEAEATEAAPQIQMAYDQPTEIVGDETIAPMPRKMRFRFEEATS